MEESNASRRRDEIEALRAVYGNETLEVDDSQSIWSLQIVDQVVLQVEIPFGYPSHEAPIPRLKAPQWRIHDGQKMDLLQELKDMWEPDTEIVLLWAEHVRSVLEEWQEGNQGGPPTDEELDAGHNGEREDTTQDPSSGLHTFVPSNAKFGQTIRRFSEEVISDPQNEREIFRGNPCHPPKGGPSECMIAHVARVHSMNHIHWVWAKLLLEDKKVARASHNMVAYRFVTSDGCLVSDNDDDGEKGSGAKLAALLELTDAQNVMVVVSRWYGGVHLGPSRFKYIAHVAREALLDGGFIEVAAKSK